MGQAEKRFQDFTIEELKRVLHSIEHPHSLNDHPWAWSGFVKEHAQKFPDLQALSRGELLLHTIKYHFLKLLPQSPPRPGKRIATKWGQFGILAARYFYPLTEGNPPPPTLEEAWRNIDESVNYFVEAKAAGDAKSESGIQLFTFSDVMELSPNSPPLSTLSDWHTRGLEDLRRLLETSNTSHIQKQKKNTALEKNRSQRLGRRVLLIIAILVLSLFSWTGVKAARIYQLGKELYNQYQGITSQNDFVDLRPQTTEHLGSQISLANQRLQKLDAEMQPFYAFAPFFRWLPGHGGDIENSRAILDYLSSLVSAADRSFDAMQPLLSVYATTDGEQPPISQQELFAQLQESQNDFQLALALLEDAERAREQIDFFSLSQQVQTEIQKVDQLLPFLKDGLMVGAQLPAAVGLGPSGPKTYLLLLQNEDELRATGGFITGVGAMTLEDGKILSFEIENSPEIDNLDLPYNALPWQMAEYMDGGLWLIRDANWSPDFPQVANFAERLYAYSKVHAVDGVIALDQHAIELLLEATGPIEVGGELVSAENVVPFMRTQKDILNEGLGYEHSKDFLPVLAQALITKIQAYESLLGQTFYEQLLHALNEKHMLVQLDNQELMDILSRRSWDGAIRRGDADYLAVIEANLGFNKVNAATETSIVYSVDLQDLSNPRAYLEIAVFNENPAFIPCIPRQELIEPGYAGLIKQCYWNYLRVYTQEGTKLIDATAHTVPGDWMITGRSVPAQVDELSELDGGYGFGTLFVVPTDSSVRTEFEFGLPIGVAVLDAEKNQITYKLNLQKQAGTMGRQIELTITPPTGYTLIDSNQPGEWKDARWTTKLTLRTDLELILVFGRE